MLTRIVKEPSFTGIAAGSIASARAFTRGNIVNFYLNMLTGAGVGLTRAQIIADVSNVVMKVNGIELISVDVTFLLDRQLYMTSSQGGAFNNGIVPIPMQLLHLPTAEQRMLPALGTADVNTISFEVTVIGVAQLATIELFTEVDNNPAEVVGQHIRIQRFTRAFAGTGLQEVSDLPYSDSNVLGILAMHIRHTVGGSVASQITVKRNGLTVVDKLTPGLNAVLLAEGKRAQQATYDTVDFGRHNSLQALLPMKDTTSLILEINWTVGAPTTYQIFMERVFKTLA